jgi:hypothetical protein
MQTKVVIFSQWPQLVVGSCKEFAVDFEESVEDALTSTFADANIENGMQRFAVRIHDRKLYADYEYVILINQPVSLDLHDLVAATDENFSTYTDNEQKFLIYRRSNFWQEKNIYVPANAHSKRKPLFEVPEEEKLERLGIIFIDCWQLVADASDWRHLPYNFDFYQNMLDVLSQYQAANMVFHTGEFGSHQLAHKLRPWHRWGNSVNIMDILSFERHYQDREIYNWIVVGAHWQLCTHDKPLGFYNLLDLKKHDSRLRIFSHMDCTVKFTNNDLEKPMVSTCTEFDYQQDTLIWKLNGRMPELIGPL